MWLWGEENPGEGNMEQLRLSIATLDRCSEQLLQMMAALQHARSRVEDAWSGVAYMNWRENLDFQIGYCVNFFDALDSSRRAYTNYCYRVEGIAHLAAPLIRELGEIRSALRADCAISSLPFTDCSALLFSRAAQDLHHDQKNNELRVLSALRHLADERRVADQLCLSAIRDAAPDAWPARRDALAAVGITTFAQASDARIFSDIQAYAGTIARGFGNAADCQQFVALAAAYQQRSSLTTVLQESLGTEGVAVLLSEVSAWVIAQKNRDHPEAAQLVLALLGSLSEQNFQTAAARYPEIGIALSEYPTEVHQWWNGYGDSEDLYSPTAEQEKLVVLAPSLIGNLEGVAYWARGQANRIVLEQKITELEQKCSRNEPDQAAVRLRLAKLITIRRALLETDSPAEKTLISLQADAPSAPLAAIAVGDLDRSAYVSFQVSGMNATTANMTDSVRDAASLYRAEVKAALYAGAEHDIAVVAWIGYEAPNFFAVVSDANADRGSYQFATAIRGYRANNVDSSEKTFLAVFAHSYGSTTVMNAVKRENLGIDAFAMYGSAGVPADIGQVSDLHIPHHQVWVGETRDDRLAPIGRTVGRRPDPAQWSDVMHFATDGGVIDPETGEMLQAAHGHSQYVQPETESLRNMAMIGINASSRVLSDQIILAPGPTSSEQLQEQGAFV